MPIYGQTTSVDTPRHPSLSWANRKDGKFIAWNRDTQAEEEIKLPESFIVVAEGWAVKGYLEAKGGVYSNEIYSFAKDILTIRASSGEILYEGYWNDIKDKVKAVGLKLTKNVHYVDPNKPEELRTFCIKGAGLKAWLETFSGEDRFAASNHLICFKEVANGKTGAVKYTYPVFNVCDALSLEEKNVQQQMGAKLIAYQESVSVSEEEAKNDEVAKNDVDELPF